MVLESIIYIRLYMFVLHFKDVLLDFDNVIFASPDIEFHNYIGNTKLFMEQYFTF